MPEDTFTATLNVEKFVRFCREELTVFGSDLDWDSETWDLTGYVVFRARLSRVRVRWLNFDTSIAESGLSMKQPFLNFAKSYFRYQHGFHPTKAYLFRLFALRALERALCAVPDNGSEPKIEDVDGAVFNRAAQLIGDKYGVRTAYCIGKNLEWIASFIIEKRLTRVSFSWKNPLHRAPDNDRVGQEDDMARARKIPTEEVLNALAKAYVTATTPRDILITSTAAVLCSAPVRIGELLTLPVECEHQDSSSEKKRYALRWWPEKGADPMLKWIVPSIEQVTQDAVKRLRQLTEPWRKVAKWYEDHPDEIYLPEEHDHLRHRQEIRIDDMLELFGVVRRESVRLWLIAKKITWCGTGVEARCSFAEFTRGVLDDLPKTFPILDLETGLRFSDAMFVVAANFFSGRNSRIMISAVVQDIFHTELGSGWKEAKTSVFSRLGITSEDGTPIVIRSHQFRHLLNTMAQRGGASQIDIAMWSGRKQLSDNNTYDHTTSEEFLAMVRTTTGGSILGPIGELIANTPIPKAEFLSVKMPTAHVTELGFCTHDWTMLPCERHLDCINCTSHACIKGDLGKTERIKDMLRRSKELLAEAEIAQTEEYTGADRWVIHQRTTVERLDNLIKILDDPDIPEGAVITLSIQGEYSAIANAVDDRIRLGGSDAERRDLSHQNRFEVLKLS